MKTFLLILFSSLIAHAQILTLSPTDKSITITPNGIQGATNDNTSISNVALGGLALFSNSGGIANTAIGNAALRSTTTGRYNTAIGTEALADNTIGYFNSANGVYALKYNTIGSSNTAIGYAALFLNVNGNSNTASGQNALGLNTSGSYNTASGVSALNKNTTGQYNTANGFEALLNNTIGSGNIGVGYNSGNAISTGTLNTFLGYNANADADISNAIAIGSNTIVNASNKVRIGDANITVIEGQVPWSNPSDRRLKENIIYTDQLGLGFISQLQTVSYNYKSDKNKTRLDGFIAQDIEQVLEKSGLTFSGLKKSTDGIYSLAYSDFVMPLVNAIKELKAKNEALEKRLIVLEELRAELNQIKTQISAQRTSEK
ncbi:tail fiber domain-containing protein [Emticicia sp. BO119]|uniref:tail fiber domain-containing protein n=1 Tax=Emticicia sp. BO119 TaxID=2757768 RepID=UPI0015EFF688|nr:tail fiber domain-containing protein [Emticicia sp. BO119]MBA4853696.1 tail fiber domain-containing protein [Emticicia sp. BO119]